MSYLLLLVYLFWLLKFFFLESAIGMMASGLLVVSSVLIFSYIFAKKIRNEIEIQMFLFCFFIALILSASFGYNYRLEDIFLSFMYLGVGAIPCFYKLEENIFKVAMIVVLVFFICHVLNNTDPNYVFVTSRNMISGVLLIFYSYYAISSYANRFDIPIWPLPICLIISIWAIGRSGILAFTCLSIVLPIIKYNLFSLKLIVFAICVCIVLSVIYINYSDIVFAPAINRFEVLGIDGGGREAFLKEYGESISSSLRSLFFGGNIKVMKSAIELGLNPHNSFVRLHMFYGLLGVIFILYFIVKSMIIFIYRKNYLYVALIVVLLLRATSDSTAFHGPFDPLIYYFIFNALSRKRNIRMVS